MLHRPDIDTALVDRGGGIEAAGRGDFSSARFLDARRTGSAGATDPWRFFGRVARLGARRSVGLACLLTFLLHLLFLSRELTSDEGGFAMASRGWRAAGPYVYGSQWVDRPPGLMVVFEAAQAMGPFGVRLVAGFCATALVAAAAWGASAVRGGRAATWSAWTAFAFAASPFLEAYQLNGELIAATLVMLACAAALHAVYRTSSSGGTVLFGLLSGTAAASALLVKQDFADGLAFVVILLSSGVVLRRVPPRRAALTVVGVVAGVALPVAATCWWAVTRGHLQALVYAMYGFRADAGDVMVEHSWRAPEDRLVHLVGLAFASGMVLLVAHLAVSQRRVLLSPNPLVWAVSGAAGLELVGVVLGANYWPHYLIGLIPTLALVAGLAAGSASLRPPAGSSRPQAERGQRATRALVVVAVATTLLAAPAAAVAVHTYRSHPYLVGRWLAVAATRSDTVVVPFTHANVIEASGLSSPYPYSWSLPLRTLDPGLTLLTHTLAQPGSAPSWVVRWDGPHTWGLDPHSHLTHALETHYRQVAVVCGHPVWLHRGMHRSLPALPEGCGPSFFLSTPARPY